MLYRLLVAILLCLQFSACADLQVQVRKDTVKLKDGTEIQCIVLAVTAKGVLIVETDPEDEEATRQRIIPAADVAEILRGEAEGAVAGFQTEHELARKVIQGTGYRKEEAPSKSDKVAKGGKGKEKEPKTPKVAEKTAPTPAEPSVPRNLKPAVEAAAPGPVSKLSAKELSEAYAARFPELKLQAQALLGMDRATQILDMAQKGDVPARAEAESFMKLFMPPDTSTLSENKVVVAPTGTRRPRRPSALATPPKVAAPAPTLPNP